MGSVSLGGFIMWLCNTLPSLVPVFAFANICRKKPSLSIKFSYLYVMANTSKFFIKLIFNRYHDQPLRY